MKIKYKQVKTFIEALPVILNFGYQIWKTIKETINEEKEKELNEEVEEQKDLANLQQELKEKAEEQKENEYNIITK